MVGYDVLPRRLQDHRKAGGTAARSCRDVAKRCDILVTSLPSAQALLDTAAELAKSARRNQIVVETSTLPIAAKEEARKRLASRGAILLDCTLSGTGAQARVKDLIVYASGDRKSYRRTAAVLDGFARAQYYVGRVWRGLQSEIRRESSGGDSQRGRRRSHGAGHEIGARSGNGAEGGRRRRGKLAHACRCAVP